MIKIFIKIIHYTILIVIRGLKFLKSRKSREIHILCAFSTSLNYTKYSFSIIRYKKNRRYQIYYPLSKNIKKLKAPQISGAK